MKTQDFKSKYLKFLLRPEAEAPVLTTNLVGAKRTLTKYETTKYLTAKDNKLTVTWDPNSVYRDVQEINTTHKYSTSETFIDLHRSPHMMTAGFCTIEYVGSEEDASGIVDVYVGNSKSIPINFSHSLLKTHSYHHRCFEARCGARVIYIPWNTTLESGDQKKLSQTLNMFAVFKFSGVTNKHLRFKLTSTVFYEILQVNPHWKIVDLSTPVDKEDEISFNEVITIVASMNKNALITKAKTPTISEIVNNLT